MAENVVGIRGEIVPQTLPPDEEVICLLEDMLERARSGDVLGVCIAFQHGDEACQWRRAGIMSYRLVGFVEGMKAQMIRSLSEP